MKKLEKIPEGWSVMNEEETIKLVDKKGHTASSIIYSVETDVSGGKCVRILSSVSREKRRGHYGILFPTLEHLAKENGATYLSGFIHADNYNSIQVHNHLGFYPVGYSVIGRERKVEVRKDAPFI